MSRSTLNRLEALAEVPGKGKDRGRAVMALLLYGMDPDDFGLGPDDVPPGIDANRLVDLGIHSTGWFSDLAQIAA